MTPAEEAVLVAARAYRDAHESGANLVPLMRDLVAASMGLVDAPPVEAPTAAVRPWPDPEAYRALACEVLVIKPLDPSKALPPGTDLSALFGVEFVGVLE